MVDPTRLAVVLTKEAWKIVDRSLKHKSTAQKHISTEMELSPMLKDIEDLARKMGLTPDETGSLRNIIKSMREARLKYTEIGGKFWLAYSYQKKLENAEKSLKEFISSWLQVYTARTVTQIRYDQINGANQAYHIRHPETTLKLNSLLMTNLSRNLMRTGAFPIFHLCGFAGSGKTTLVQQLCDDTRFQEFFNNIIYVPSCLKIESNGDLASRLKVDLRKNKGQTVLLVLDNAELATDGLGQIVDQYRQRLRMNSKSKILVISKDALSSLKTPEANTMTMTPLGEHDAINLLRHFVQPAGATIPDDPTLLQKVISSCGCFPIEIKLIGAQLRGKSIPFWLKKLDEWRQAQSTELLTRLQDSLSVSKEFESITEFFKDLGLFPQDELVPVVALIDMWVELHQQGEDGLDAMINIRRLTDMNLAELEVLRISLEKDDDSGYNNHFIEQHGVLRELAIHMSEQEPLENRRRLIIDMIDRDQPPQGWPQNQLINVAASMLSISTDQNITPDWCNIEAASAVVLVLNLRTPEYTLPEFIQKMEALKVLIITNHGVRTAELRNFDLLRFLGITRIRLQYVTVPSLCDLKKVRKLSFFRCQVKKAFAEKSIKFSEAMPNLAELNIDYCNDFVKFPVAFCSVVALKKLHINSCPKFRKLPKEIRRLQELKLLRICQCTKFKKMPVSITELENLSLLDTSYCINLRKLPDRIVELRSLKCLKVMHCPISNLSDLAYLNRERVKILAD